MFMMVSIDPVRPRRLLDFISFEKMRAPWPAVGSRVSLWKRTGEDLEARQTMRDDDAGQTDDAGQDDAGHDAHDAGQTKRPQDLSGQ